MILSPSRQSAIQSARRFLQSHPVFLDTETTGLHPSAEIIEICILDVDGKALIDLLVRPRYHIPEEATRLHGITDSMVGQSLPWPEVWPDVAAALRDRSVGIYNAEFDLRMLRQSHAAHNMAWQSVGASAFCIMKLYSQFSGVDRWISLGQAGRACGIKFPNAHRARADSLLARALLLYIAQEDEK
jgi:DNA polymerase III subunit epsilon